MISLNIVDLHTSNHGLLIILSYNISNYCRSPDDYYDRYWFPLQGSNSTFLQSTNSGLQILMTNHSVVTFNKEDLPPEAVMRTALTDTSGNITISFPDTNSYQGYLSLYVAELDPTANATSRIYYADVPLSAPLLINPVLIDAKFSTADGAFDSIAYTKGWTILLYQNPITPSPLGPLLNALELLEVRTGHMATLTNPQDGEPIIWLCLLLILIRRHPKTFHMKGITNFASQVSMLERVIHSVIQLCVASKKFNVGSFDINFCFVRHCPSKNS
jgi:hypothetical protein